MIVTEEYDQSVRKNCRDALDKAYAEGKVCVCFVCRDVRARTHTRTHTHTCMRVYKNNKMYHVYALCTYNTQTCLHTCSTCM